MSDWKELILDVLCASLVTVTMSGLSYVLLGPKIGVDDANITQVYAQRLVSGEGFRYNVGGETVEGCTSLLWTLLLVPFFFVSDRPEAAIAAFCGLLAIGTVALALRLSRTLAPMLEVSPRAAAIGTAGAFTLFPPFFLWSVWTLMDVTLWVLLLSGLLHSVTYLFLTRSEGAEIPRAPIMALIVCAVLTPLTRPEGAAVTIGLCGILVAGALCLKHRSLLVLSIAAIGLALTCTAGVTLWRLSYFGQALPNTVYAKVSTDWFHQAKVGLIYLANFMAHPVHAVAVALITAASLFVIVDRPHRALANRASWCFLSMACYVWGILALYTLAGGDHFRSFRFFQPTVPLLAVAVGLAFCWIGRSALEATSSKVPMIGALALSSLFVFMSHLTLFVTNRGDIAHEFRFAEAGRQIGNTLNSLSWSPSVGVITAGGVARTYHGQLYDLMGLNWKRMAHAVGNLSGNVRNHGAFDPTVFFEVTPDIVSPTIGRCALGGGYPSEFDQIVLKNVFADARFVRLYAPACFRGLIFFVKREQLATRAELTQPR